MDDLFESIQDAYARHCMVWTDRASGLRAVLVIDDTTLGPAAGGVRTQPYPSPMDAIRDAAWLAKAMTRKCALADIDAGGGKLVVLEHAGMDRAACFSRLGELVEDLGGAFLTGSDLGTTAEDLQQMAAHTAHVHTDEARVVQAVARGVRRATEALVRVRGGVEMQGLRVAVQGCGHVGAAVAKELSSAGAELVVADRQRALADALANEIGAKVVAPEDVLSADVDVLSPCAVSGIITPRKAGEIRAWGLCPGGNNVLTSTESAEVLHARGILHVPDIVSSAGGVIWGIGLDLMKLDDAAALIDRIGERSESILQESLSRDVHTLAIAKERASARLRAAAG